MADKPSHAYYAFCRHQGHRASECKDKPMRGSPHPTVPGAMVFKKTAPKSRRSGT